MEENAQEIVDMAAELENNEPVNDEPIQDPTDGEETPGSDEPKKGGVQKKFDKLTKARRQAELEAAYYKGQLEAMQKAGTNIQPGAPKAVKEPQESDFDSHDAYLDARIEFKAAKIAEQKTAELIKQQKEAEKQRKELKEAETIAAQYKAAQKKYDDFDEVVKDAPVPWTQDIINAAKGENYCDILYKMAKTPGLVEKIAMMSPTDQIKQVAIVENGLKTKKTPEKKQSKAPAPVPVVGSGGSATINSDTSKMSIKELRAKWDKDRLNALGVSTG